MCYEQRPCFSNWEVGFRFFTDSNWGVRVKSRLDPLSMPAENTAAGWGAAPAPRLWMERLFAWLE